MIRNIDCSQHSKKNTLDKALVSREVKKGGISGVQTWVRRVLFAYKGTLLENSKYPLDIMMNSNNIVKRWCSLLCIYSAVTFITANLIYSRYVCIHVLWLDLLTYLCDFTGIHT